MRTGTLIVGAGFAGLSTAYHLARRRAGPILVLEREATMGTHASGRNAGLLRQSSADKALLPLLREGARAARMLLRRIPGAFAQRGSLILGPAAGSLRAGSRAELLPAASKVEGLWGEGLFDPEDGTLDPQALLGIYAKGARGRGVEIRCGEGVESLEVRDGAVVAARTPLGRITFDRLVIAAGAWAGEVAALAGSRSIPVVSRRRHLFRARLAGRAISHLPFVWDEGKGVYFRPEGDGVVASPCDTEEHPPGTPEVDPIQRERLAEKMAHGFGALGEWSIGPGWACLRTFVPDERFVIGRDPGIAGLYWVSCLGGHGMTASYAIGRHAARVILGEIAAGPFEPGRSHAEGLR